MTVWVECACNPLRMTRRQREARAKLKIAVCGGLTSQNDNALVTIRVGRVKKR